MQIYKSDLTIFSNFLRKLKQELLVTFENYILILKTRFLKKSFLFKKHISLYNT